MRARGAPGTSIRRLRTVSVALGALIALVAAALLAAGCSGGSGDSASAEGGDRGDEPPDEPPPPPGPDAEQPEAPDPPPEPDPMPPPAETAPGPDLVAAAVQDAAQRTGVDPGNIEVRIAEPVTWPDGSLGCPQPGMMYTQALVPGYRIVVEAAGEDLHYHAANGALPAFCAEPRMPTTR